MVSSYQDFSLSPPELSSVSWGNLPGTSLLGGDSGFQMFLSGGCIMPLYDHWSLERESWRATLGAYITEFGNGILPPMSHCSELVMWLQSNCEGIWDLGESTRLFSETVMSWSQTEKMKGMSLRQVSGISVKVVNMGCSSLLMASLNAGIFSLILTCVLVVLIERRTYLCRSLSVSRTDLLPLLKTFYCNFCWKFPSQSVYEWYKGIGCIFFSFCGSYFQVRFLKRLQDKTNWQKYWSRQTEQRRQWVLWMQNGTSLEMTEI